ncbi:hypothetical protein WR25_04823 isoform A [Diploscapter pachys]|uniref:Pinin/SDK/MemA protein domain-containing protein n=1 Tax=Diploscapter pachys TaxID=2018661 RepID=A0A2A2J7B8_9BILA|nr:hypothetical protein WR25_04823 isoform A [Diploscapter pachys]
MTETLSRDIEKAQERLRSIDSDLASLPRGAGGRGINDRVDGRGFGMKRRLTDEGPTGGNRFGYERGGGGRLSNDDNSFDGGPMKRRVDMSGGSAYGKRARVDYNDIDNDYDDRPSKTLQSTVVMPTIETKSREQKIEEINKSEKKEVVSRNKRMFSNLLMGTLNKFKKEESKIQSVEQKQAEKQREVEKRLEDTKREEKEKFNAERNRLMEARQEEERKLQSMQRKRALIQYAETKINQYKLMANFIETQAKPTLFFMPVKHTVRSLELLKNTSKHMDRLIELRQGELERELAVSPSDNVRRRGGKNGNDEGHHSDDENPGNNGEDKKPSVKVIASSTR